jgi:hypothetical protein
MTIAIQTPAQTRARAMAAANPSLTVAEIGRVTGLRPSLVRLALGRRDKRRVKTVAPDA